MTDDIYVTLAREKPISPVLGGVYATLVQAHEQREEDYNRWYEDDHFITGGTSGPWIFAGRRFVQSGLPVHRDGPDAPAEVGSFITLYFALGGHVEDSARWIREMWHSLEGEGRGAKNRRHLYSTMHEVAVERIFDPAPMKSIHALHFPYGSMAVEFYDAPTSADRERLTPWLRDELTEGHLDSSGQCLALVPAPLDDDRLGKFGWGTEILPRRVCVLWFLHDPAPTAWPASFTGHATAAERTGFAKLSYRAMFLPTRPGTPTPLITT